MPIIKYNGKVVYFAHVPKCGGTSVEKYLEQLFGEVSFLDSKWWRIGKEKWNKSSPQHIQCDALFRLFSDDFFDASFTVVRHPAKRFLSAFNYNRELGRIHWSCGAERFLTRLMNSRDYFGYKYDNHFLPAARFVPENSRVFHLDTDLEKLDRWIGDCFGIDTSSAQIEVKNKSSYATASDLPPNFFTKKRFQPKVGTLSEEALEQVFTLYSEDYKTFEFDKYPEAVERDANLAVSG